MKLLAVWYILKAREILLKRFVVLSRIKPTYGYGGLLKEAPLVTSNSQLVQDL
jgi:hypothetical protein